MYTFYRCHAAYCLSSGITFFNPSILYSMNSYERQYSLVKNEHEYDEVHIDSSEHSGYFYSFQTHSFIAYNVATTFSLAHILSAELNYVD